MQYNIFFVLCFLEEWRMSEVCTPVGFQCNHNFRLQKNFFQHIIVVSLLCRLTIVVSFKNYKTVLRDQNIKIRDTII